LEGAFSSVTTFIPKIILVATTALPLAWIAAAGYVPTTDAADCVSTPCAKVPQPQPDGVKFLVRMLFGAVPALLTAISCWVKLAYPIKNKAIMGKITEGIQLHKQGKSAQDPITGNWVGVMATERDAEEKVWAMLHFSSSAIEEYSARGQGPLVRRMTWHCILAAGATLTSIIVTG
jgi:hypothetical protein